MPLSEHEQRLLEQIEQALYAEDPKFASLYRSTDLHRHHRRRIWRSVAAFVVGLGLLLAGVVTELVAMGVAGFVVMLAAASLLVASLQRMHGRAAVPVEGAAPAEVPDRRVVAMPARGGRFRRSPVRGPSPAAPRPRRSLISRLEERWQRRQDER